LPRGGKYNLGSFYYLIDTKESPYMISDNADIYLFPDMAKSPDLTNDAPTVLLKPIDTPIWTQNKAHLVAKYIDLFTVITKHGTYIDGFAGPQYAHQLDLWAAKLVLLNKPGRIRKYFLFDKNPAQVKRINTMVAALPPLEGGDNKRKITVEVGDCNVKILELLDNRLILPSEATFALLDQRNFECNWKTLVSLAAYKPPGRSKIELFYFLPSAWFQRATKNRRKQEKLDEVDAWWGSDQWRSLSNQGPWERMQILRERFIEELGYTYVTPLPIYESANGCGTIMYFMIHASDHPDAPKLMRRAYEKSVTRRPLVMQMSLYNDIE
jgi:three-Cys-motif partner protein